jgi:hypothetical protein
MPIQGFFENRVDHLFASTIFYLCKSLGDIWQSLLQIWEVQKSYAYSKLESDVVICYKQRKANDTMELIGELKVEM